MATLPTFPSFASSSVPSVATLNQLGYAVSFVSQVPIVISLKLSGAQSITANTNTAVSWNVSEVDTDGMHSNVTNPTRLTCQTQGYYRVHTTLALKFGSGSQTYQTWFQQTTGSNNPAGSGHTVLFGGEGGQSDSSSSDVISVSMGCMTPVLYVNDYVEAWVWCPNSMQVNNNFEQTANLDTAGFKDGSSSLYGFYVCEGP